MIRIFSAAFLFLIITSSAPAQQPTASGNGKRVFERTFVVHDRSEQTISGQTIGAGDQEQTQSEQSLQADGYQPVVQQSNVGETGKQKPSKVLLANLSPYTPTGWTAPISITNVANHTLQAATDAATIFSNENVYISFASVNNSVDPTPAVTFYVNIYVDNILVFEGNFASSLPANNFVYWINRSIGTFSAGSHTFRMEIDPTNVITESNESDNTYSRSKSISTAGSPPSVTNYTPSQGPVGTLVTIAGANFGSTQGSSTVKFASTTASVNSWSNTQIIVTVPNLPAGTYFISVTTPAGTAPEVLSFTITSSTVHTISSFTPTSGAIGTAVTISGTNFGSTQGSSTVLIGGLSATITSWSASQIIAVVPALATGSYSVAVVVSSVTVTAGTQFTVTGSITYPDPLPAMYKTTVSTGITTSYLNLMTEAGTIVWMAGDNGLIAQTSSIMPGATVLWNLANFGIPPSEDIYALSFVNSSVGVAGTASGNIYRTSDGGSSWMPVYNNPSVTNFINYIKMESSGAGIAMGDGISTTSSMAFLYTSDGGLTWTNKNSYLAGTSTPSNVSFTSATTGFMAGNYNTGTRILRGIFKTTNSGVSWSFYTVGNTTSDSTTSIEALAFRNSSVGMAVKADSTVWKTTNGGTVWSKVGQLPRMAYGIEYTSGTTAAIVGRNGLFAVASVGGAVPVLYSALLDESLDFHQVGFSNTFSAILLPAYNAVRTYFSSVNSSSPLGTPTLSTPSNGSQISATNTTLSWSSVIGATAYDIEVGTAISSNIRGKLYTSKTSTVGVSGLAPGTSYQWRVRARSATNSGAWSAANVFTVQTLQLVSSSVSTFPSSPKSSADYRLISIPNSTTSTVNDYIKGSSPNDFRIFLDNGGTPPNHLTELNGSNQLVIGKGYWLVMRNTFSINTMLSFPAPSSTTGAVNITTQPGWNIIGIPFTIPVKWNDIKTLNGLSATSKAYGYYGASGFLPADVLEPFQGYYFFSSSGTLAIPFPFSETPSVTVQQPALEITVSHSSSTNTDSFLRIGIDPAAKEGNDDFELRKPPVFSDQAAVWVDRPEWDSEHSRYATDIRPAFGDGQTWNIVLQHPENESSTLALHNLEHLPNGYDVIVIDNSSTVIMKPDANGNVTIPQGKGTSEYSIVIGKPSYLRSRTESLIPQEFSLYQNYPNPFNPETSIRFGLRDDARVQITVYDMLGRELSTPANGIFIGGNHHISFNAKGLASGTYFYSLRVTSIADGTMLFRTTKKMTLLK